MIVVCCDNNIAATTIELSTEPGTMQWSKRAWLLSGRILKAV
jgi:hypothetical protein